MTEGLKPIELPHIKTEVAAKNVSKLLEENKTYFLNGAWGSGKSTFLKQIEDLPENNKRFVNLDLWKLTDSRSVIEVAFSRLNIWLYLILKMFVSACVAISILLTPQINIGFSQFFPNWLFFVIGLIGLSAAVYQFFRPKSDGLYQFLWNLKFFPTLFLNKKILIIDDFDRLTEGQQKEAYKLFALLNGKLPIIFVGDFEKVDKTVDANFLSKIIDRRIELPFVLHPSSIWDSYFKQIDETFHIYLSQKFKDLIKKDLKNLRDREHFNDYVNQEFFERGKFGHVQIEQQLVLIYTYLFNPTIYQFLVNNTDKEGTPIIESNDSKLEPIKELLSIKKERHSMNESYPRPFFKDRQAYFIYEEATNMTVEELEDLFSESEIKQAVLLNSDSDFYQYLRANFYSLPPERRELIIKVALNFIGKYENSATIQLIIQEERRRYSEMKDDNVIKYWDDYLNSVSFNLSQKLYFYAKYNIFSVEKLANLFSSEINPQDLLKSNDNRKFIMLLVYLANKNLRKEYSKWTDEIWNLVNQLDDIQFLKFWIVQGIIHYQNPFDIDYLPTEKKLNVWTNEYDDEQQSVVDNTMIVDKLKGRLDAIHQKHGYYFKYRQKV